jgi:ABC-type multidrug transport system ATPase subunit
MIGYVPQDDLLFEELTVYQNLFYNACLCFGNMSKQEITGIVNKQSANWGLEEIRDLKVVHH